MSKGERLSRRDFLRLSALATAGLALSACKSAAPAGEEQAAEKTAAIPPKKEEVTISWWSFSIGLPADEWPHGKWEGSVADEYTEMDNGVTIEYQALGWDSLAKVSTSIAAGTPPELLLRAGHNMVNRGVQAGVAVQVELQEDLKEDLPEGWYEGMLWQGKNYLVPFYIMAQGPILNVSIVKEAGAEDLLPKEPDRSWDIDQWLELMKACTFERDDGSKVYGYVIYTTAGNPFFHWTQWLLMWNYGADTIKYDPDKGWHCVLDEPIGVEWLQFMQDLYTKHGITPNPAGLDVSVKGELWKQNQNAYYPGPAIGMARQVGATVDKDTLIVTDPAGFEWMFVRNPTKPGVQHTTWGGPGLDVSLMPFKTENEVVEETIEFAHWLANRDHENFLAKYILPVRVSAMESVAGDPLIKWMFDNWIPNSRFRWVSGCAKEEAEAFQTAWQKLYLPTDPQEVANWFRGEIDRMTCFLE